jgi:hypothetical protein
MGGSFSYAFQGNGERESSPGRFMESTRSSSKETIGNWGGGGTAQPAGFLTTTTFTAHSAPGPEISLEKQNFVSPQPPRISCLLFPVTEIKTNFKGRGLESVGKVKDESWSS